MNYIMVAYIIADKKFFSSKMPSSGTCAEKIILYNSKHHLGAGEREELNMTSASICIIISIAVYLIGMLYIGFIYSKRNATTSDFYLGGRKLGPIVVALSTEASDMSSWLLMGVPGLAYFCGRRHLDGYRPGRGHLPELADRGKAPEKIFRPH